MTLNVRQGASEELADVIQAVKDDCDATQSTFVLRYEYGKFTVDVTPCEYKFYPRDTALDALWDALNYLGSKP